MKTWKDSGTVLIGAILCCLVLGCASARPIMPAIDLPAPPQKPAIKSVIVPYQNSFLVGYPMHDSLALYEFLLKKDSYEEKLRFRIETMNQILGAK